MDSNYNEYKVLNNTFGSITSDLSLKDWRKIRTSDYWMCDRIKSDVDKLRFKIDFIQNWKIKNKI